MILKDIYIRCVKNEKGSRCICICIVRNIPRDARISTVATQNLIDVGGRGGNPRSAKPSSTVPPSPRGVTFARRCTGARARATVELCSLRPTIEISVIGETASVGSVPSGGDRLQRVSRRTRRGTHKKRRTSRSRSRASPADTRRRGENHTHTHGGRLPVRRPVTGVRVARGTYIHRRSEILPSRD